MIEEDHIDAILRTMTLAEKVGQMTQVSVSTIHNRLKVISEYHLGSVLSGGGGNPQEGNTPETWRKMVTSCIDLSTRTRTKIPLIYGVDAVHGHNNLYGATIFPHNIGLGATRDSELLEKIGHATALECLATNVFWNFAPAVSIPQDIRWGRSYEGYGEDSDLVTELSRAYIRGLQTPQGPNLQWVLPSVKHFIADGATEFGSSALRAGHLDQGDARISEETLRKVHLAPYIAAISEGALNIMVSFSSWNGIKMHGNKYLLTDVLKSELGFSGFLVSDWQAIDQISENYYQCVVRSINAGIDMVMVPAKFENFIATLTKAVGKGDVPIERLDDAVRRILRAKFALGLFKTPKADASLIKSVGCTAHRDLAREAVRKSAVLLKNEGNCLPIPKNLEKLIVVGKAADDIGLACGGWTIEWQGGRGAITTGTTLLTGIKKNTKQAQYFSEMDYSTRAEFTDYGIVVVHEYPYAEMRGDSEDLELSAEQKTAIESLRGNCSKLILVIYSGRPVIISEVVPMCDAIVAAWLPGTEADGISELLFGDFEFSGKLPFTWYESMDQMPLTNLKETGAEPLYPFGHGL